MYICHANNSLKKTVYGDSESQFIFDVYSSNLILQEFMFEMTQESLTSIKEIGINIYKVEVNRKFRLKQPYSEPCDSSIKCTSRILFTRTQLKAGRYILVPHTTGQTKLMIRTNCQSLRPVQQFMTPNRLMKFLPLKTARYVTKVTILNISCLDLRDKFRSEYC